MENTKAKTRARKIIEDNKRPVNYSVTGMITFKDGTVLSKQGSKTKVKATDAKEAEKLYREGVYARWDKGDNGVAKIEIMAVKKG